MNRFGLSRYIPTDVRRTVRHRCKFGCVECRRGVYQYEHIDPIFQEAAEHSADNICCLCASCHDLVTRGQLSKEKIKASYAAISAARAEDVAPPAGPLDFSSGESRLEIGGLLYHPIVRTVLRYHGDDLITLSPASLPGEPGVLSAQFADDQGVPSLAIDQNEWVASPDQWDIEVTANRLQVRSRKGRVVLGLRMEPPTRLVVERLDMRVGDGHVLVGEDAYAAGRYVSEDLVRWAFARVRFYDPPPEAVAIEFVEPEELERRDQDHASSSSDLATVGRWFVVNGRVGCLFKPLGIAVATMCSGLEFIEAATGFRTLDETREVVFRSPGSLVEFLGSGKFSD